VVTDVASDLQDQGLGAKLVIDRDTAARLGIAMADVDNTLYDAFGQRQVSTIFTQLNQYHVVMEVGQNFQTDPSTLNNLYVKSGNGTQVPLSMVAHWEQSTRNWPSATRASSPPPWSASTWRRARRWATPSRPSTASSSASRCRPAINASFQGTAAAFQTSLANEPLLILAALITVYIVLGVLYESYIHPITIISTLPSAGVGALLALLITRVEFSVIALIGIILLIGIVQKNAIMMIDFALQAERERGQDRRGRHLPGLPVALQAHHHDHHGRHAGRIAAGPGRRRGRRAAHAAGHHHRRRTDLFAGAHALHRAGDLSLLRQAGAAHEAARSWRSFTNSNRLARTEEKDSMHLSAPFISAR
jgi:multidrug efflux pump subunit AcrB